MKTFTKIKKYDKDIDKYNLIGHGGSKTALPVFCLRFKRVYDISIPMFAVRMGLGVSWIQKVFG